jgi:hypothetical protein
LIYTCLSTSYDFFYHFAIQLLRENMAIIFLAASSESH